MSAERSVHIEAPVEKVFDFFKDPGNWQELARGVAFTDVEPVPVGRGTSYRWVTKVAGVRVEGTGTFTGFVPDRRITDESSWPVEGTWTYEFRPDGTGTRMTLRNRPRGFWATPPIRTLVGWVTVRSHAGVMAALKKRMEA